MTDQVQTIVIAGMRIQPGDPVVVLETVKNENGTSHVLPYNTAVHEIDEIDGLALTGGPAGTPVTVVRRGFAEILSDVPAKVGHRTAGSKLVVTGCDPVESDGKTRYRFSVMVDGPEIPTPTDPEEIDLEEIDAG